ncbi:hypothetical protein SPRG_08864 [Saprolegnia parasitica CBS 223.65]|uniref:Uncharacterized protein n=1 Tax=Saprolegnia parasitica (strain CBS 223.65) TaxID=695850 RepID=A0A067C5X5_SAPPC|nr:hypothetical protein SPRG_08864 [Saprolegnia parasitica CBS 223.65]KDO25923.1 hypothetical protein SPRG_08864 [Saprolegnia parasitica CBS 223.65]|eukprot:XP_012203483.1 hypothetical protein SPRG_08864 [Saprolegnia parasitica CBS 223.65]
MQKKACTDVDCSHLAPAVNMNCVNECTSPDCYALVYASEPLEDGEVDEYRAHRFTSCLRKEFLKRKPTAKTSRDEL